MKNEDKGKLKYIGAVVVIALLAGIGLASADNTEIGNGYAWFNNSDQYRTNTLRVNDTSVNDNSAVEVDFTRTGGYQTFAYGVNVTGAQTDRGANTAIRGQTSLNTAGQDGLTIGSLAGSCGWHSHGHFSGVYGRSTPNSLSNFDSSFTSTGLGGKFYTGPDDNHTLTLGTGTYWVGGVYGEVNGTIDGTPTAGAVAGVIGIDNTNTTGTAQSYAGYFDGSVRVTDNVCIGDVGDPTYKAYVHQSSGENGATGLFAEVVSPSAGSSHVYGVKGHATATDHGYHYGVHGTAYRSIGAQEGRAYGVFGKAGNAYSGYNYGVFGQLIGDKGGAAIYGTVEGDSEVDGRWAGYFNGNVSVGGIGTTDPQRALHVNDVMRLKPRPTAPSIPMEGDIYVNSSDHHIYCRLNGTWKQLDN